MMAKRQNSNEELSQEKVVFLQTMITDYRTKFFQFLCEAFEKKEISYSLITGASYFYDELKDGSGDLKMVEKINNYMFCGKRIMYQGIPLKRVLRTPIVFFEFNPRMISTWIFVFLRWILGRRNVGWGALL